jgi:ubiquinone/menaquinone biosynthesis C-methylase UbiE
MEYLPTGRALIDPFNALEKAGIREEMRVADFGVGAVGHFLFPAAQLVGPKGHVYGVDVMPSVLQANQSRIKLAGADNIQLVWGDFERQGGSRLPDTSMDMVVMVNVLHAVNKPTALQEAKRVLATGGQLLVIEWKAAGTLIGPAPEKRISKDEVAAAASQAGFLVVKEFEAGPSHYGIVLKKP